jgi:hypothetical protein
MPPHLPFSQRQGFIGQEITIREAAPEKLRHWLLEVATGLGWSTSVLRPIVWRVLVTLPDQPSSGEAAILAELHTLVNSCKWFKVYDLIEAIEHFFYEHDSRDSHRHCAPDFADAVNTFFIEHGIGWQLVDGEIVTRGAEAFEGAVRTAAEELRGDQRPTAATQIHDALQALSRRPEPNFRGAIVHGMGALECLARDLTGDPKATLGEILKRHPNLLPKPVDEAMSKLWGYASNEARHVEEGREPLREDAEMIVGLAATITTYLTRKHRGESR